MHQTVTVDRVILVVTDGLRPDAIDEFGLTHISALRTWGASTMEALTVLPSRGWAALTALMTGAPADSDSWAENTAQPSALKPAPKPIPHLLARHRLPSSAFLGDVPPADRLFAARLGKRLGFSTVGFTGSTAPGIALAAREILKWQRRGLVVIRLRDVDVAGHAHGWMSKRYAEAAKQVDAAIGSTAAIAGVPFDPRTLLVVISGHGGGGVHPKGHDSAHSLDRTIPLIVAGGAVAVASKLPASASLLDVSATILFALGVAPPASYTGRVLRASFAASPVTDQAA
jgi:Type I phosphodiesterase / nucleotide pyrophosphatase